MNEYISIRLKEIQNEWFLYINIRLMYTNRICYDKHIADDLLTKENKLVEQFNNLSKSLLLLDNIGAY